MEMKYERTVSQNSDLKFVTKSKDNYRQKKRKQRYRSKWENTFPFLQPSTQGEYYYHCKICMFDGKVGITEIKNHARSARHKQKTLIRQGEASEVQWTQAAGTNLFQDSDANHSELCREVAESDTAEENLSTTSECPTAEVTWFMDMEEKTNRKALHKSNNVIKYIDESSTNPLQIGNNAMLKRNSRVGDISDQLNVSHIKQDDRFDIVGKNVAIKLRHLPHVQRIITEKIINDALFEAEMGTLTVAHRLMIPPKT